MFVIPRWIALYLFFLLLGLVYAVYRLFIAPDGITLYLTFVEACVLILLLIFWLGRLHGVLWFTRIFTLLIFVSSLIFINTVNILSVLIQFLFMCYFFFSSEPKKFLEKNR